MGIGCAANLTKPQRAIFLSPTPARRSNHQSVLLGGKEVELSHPSLVRTGQEFELRINPQTPGLSLGELSVRSSSADATVTKLAADADGYYANVVVKESTADSLALNLLVDSNKDGDFVDESDQSLKISIPML